jgi:amino acid transporter
VGLETVLILFGLIAGAFADHGSKLEAAAHTCLTIGIVMVELVLVLLVLALGALGLRSTSKRGW